MSGSARSRGAHSGPRRRASWLLARYRTVVPPAHPGARTDPGHPSLPAEADLISSPAPANSRPPPQLDGYRRGGESEPDVPAGLSDPGQVDLSRLTHPGDSPAPVRSEERSLDGPSTGPRRRLDGAFSRSTLLRICGVAPIDSMLRLLPAARGDVLRYTQWADPNGHSSVTFASVAYYRE